MVFYNVPCNVLYGFIRLSTKKLQSTRISEGNTRRLPRPGKGYTGVVRQGRF